MRDCFGDKNDQPNPVLSCVRHKKEPFVCFIVQFSKDNFVLICNTIPFPILF